jgi:tetratricopeptide (TPR) repeat protein
MKTDIRGLAVSTDSAEAVGALDRAIAAALRFHRDTPQHLAAALAADPGFSLAHCMRGYLLSLAANPANRPAVGQVLATAQAAAVNATPREKHHVAALEAWSREAMDEAFAIWGRILDEAPTDLLALRMRDTNWFRHGQTAAIRAQADRVAPAWGEDVPGHDQFLALWAFAHEESGDYGPAEDAVDRAHAADPTNFFAHHVKAHILEMENRPAEGRDWLDAQIPHWPLGNALVHHLWWHRALMELELGGAPAMLARYDNDIRNFEDALTKATPDFYIDLQNAAALLWRLEQLGIDVGNRWDELADKAEAQTGNTGHPLLVPHLMMALVAAGRTQAADRFLNALRDVARAGTLWATPALRDVVIPVCEAVARHRAGDHSAVVELLLPRRDQIRLLGGSNAQRDMFHQMLTHSAMRAGRRDVVETLIAHEAATRSVPPTDRIGYAAAARWVG